MRDRNGVALGQRLPIPMPSGGIQRPPSGQIMRPAAWGRPDWASLMDPMLQQPAPTVQPDEDCIDRLNHLEALYRDVWDNYGILARASNRAANQGDDIGAATFQKALGELLVELRRRSREIERLRRECAGLQR